MLLIDYIYGKRRLMEPKIFKKRGNADWNELTECFSGKNRVFSSKSARPFQFFVSAPSQNRSEWVTVGFKPNWVGVDKGEYVV